MPEPCLYCGGPDCRDDLPEGCRRLCEEIADEAAACYVRERWTAVWMTLRQRAKSCDRFYMSRRRRLFYVLKALVCLWLERDCRPVDDVWETYDYIDVAYWGLGPVGGEYSGSRWTELLVGRGLFRGWWYAIQEDSSI